ncbi:MAG: glycosyl transferase [Bernardetiaceae bacterium]|nr:glycosyl transferase [Bernardetiaceae bacterium]
MRILYALQGTGNGHISRAQTIIPLLRQRAETDILVSGEASDLSLPYPIRFTLKGLGFQFGTKGGVDMGRSLRKANFLRFMQDIRQLPVSEYDLVIQDFEPISAWAAKWRGVPCVALSHQASLLHPDCPKPNYKSPLSMQVLKHYAPAMAYYGFHFMPLDKWVFTPVIRQKVREAQVSNKGHYTVYLPAYSDAWLIDFLSDFKDIRWEVFSKNTKIHTRIGHISLYPPHDEHFIKSMASAKGVLCGAGFETPAEALFMGKKLLVVPMENQYEQHYNAAALQAMNIPVIKNLKKKQQKKVQQWLYKAEAISVDYPDQTHHIIDQILHEHIPNAAELIRKKQFLDRLNPLHYEQS